MFRYPWGDFHSLNLGWFLQKFNELLQDWATAEAGIDGALDAEIQRAEDALSDVFAARDAAAASASAANSSAQNASSSALNASQSSIASMDARDAARQAATNAAASETAAGNSATAAGNSETAAAGSASRANQSATNAATSATQASSSATNAAASETAAGNSATAAAASERAAAASAATAEEIEQSIPEDYTILSAEVENSSPTAFSEYMPAYFTDRHYGKRINLYKNRFKIELEGSISTTYVWWSLFGAAYVGTGASFPTSGITDDMLADFTSGKTNLILTRFVKSVRTSTFNSFYVFTKNPETGDITNVAAINNGLGSLRSVNLTDLLPQIVSNKNFGIVYRCVSNAYTDEVSYWLTATPDPEAQNIVSNTHLIDDTTTTRAYGVNEIIMLYGVLYKVIAPIANGSQLIVNTNIERTTLGELITNILNS